jgi:PHD/YefM family antitoxin component YafN of YafNO toxin-antitoxin module
MSLQRVIDIARKNGMPVVVTDPAGHYPMVVLSLEQFEAMAEMESLSRNEKRDWEGWDSDDEEDKTFYGDPIVLDDILEDAAEKVKPPVATAAVDELVPPIFSSKVEKTVDDASVLAPKTVPIQPKSNLDVFAESPLEEGFYLEPLEDK